MQISEFGRTEAESAAIELAPKKFDCIIHSTYQRTADTAQVFARARCAPIYSSASIDEPDYGIFDGRLWTEFGAWAKVNGLHAKPEGATMSWIESLLDAVDYLASLDGSSLSILVIGHGYLWSALRTYQELGLVPTIHNISSPPHLRVLTISNEELMVFGRQTRLQYAI